MPSGVDWRLPLPKCEALLAGLPREEGMLMAAVMRAKDGCGEGMRGRATRRWSPLRKDMAEVR